MTLAARILIASLAVAAASTAGDWVWARFIPAHRAPYGLAHGTLLCLVIGLALGLPRGAPARGAALGAVIGFVAAAGFYALAPLLGYAAMFPMWMALWAAFGAVSSRALGRPVESWRVALARGCAAAVGSGLAFYLVSGMWTRPSPGGPDYPGHFVRWTIAYLPAFAALLARREAGKGL